jgi:hypothetical protein
MKIVPIGKIRNPVTGTCYTIYGRESEPGDKPIRGLWGYKKKQEEKTRKKRKK